MIDNGTIIHCIIYIIFVVVMHYNAISCCLLDSCTSTYYSTCLSIFDTQQCVYKAMYDENIIILKTSFMIFCVLPYCRYLYKIVKELYFICYENYK
jgi:hypothetical protein